MLPSTLLARSAPCFALRAVLASAEPLLSEFPSKGTGQERVTFATRATTDTQLECTETIFLDGLVWVGRDPQTPIAPCLGTTAPEKKSVPIFPTGPFKH